MPHRKVATSVAAKLIVATSSTMRAFRRAGVHLRAAPRRGRSGDSDGVFPAGGRGATAVRPVSLLTIRTPSPLPLQRVHRGSRPPSVDARPLGLVTMRILGS